MRSQVLWSERFPADEEGGATVAWDVAFKPDGSLLVVAASWLQSDLRGEYDPAAEYEPGQVVSYGGVYYVRVGGRAAGNPPGGAYWRQAAPAVSALAYFTAGSNFLPFFGM